MKSLEAQIAERGVPVRLHVMQSNGGVMTSTAAQRIPIQNSSPARSAARLADGR